MKYAQGMANGFRVSYKCSVLCCFYILAYDNLFTMSKSTGEVIEIIYLCIVAALILLGNALVMLAFAKGPRQLRTLTNYFVVNLAISDMMVGCLSVPFWICIQLGKFLF